MEKEVEQFRLIPGHMGYMASSLGRIIKMGEFRKSEQDREVKAGKQNGMLVVNVTKGEGKERSPTVATVARLVCLGFHGLPPSKHAVAKHREEPRTNNRPENVYWHDPHAEKYQPKEGVSWKTIPGYPGYLAASDGDIITLERHRLVPVRVSSGQEVINIRLTTGKRVCRTVANLMALAFIGKPPEGFGPKQVYAKHLDGNKANNAASNLYWRTPETKEGAKC